MAEHEKWLSVTTCNILQLSVSGSLLWVLLPLLPVALQHQNHWVPWSMIICESMTHEMSCSQNRKQLRSVLSLPLFCECLSQYPPPAKGQTCRSPWGQGSTRGTGSKISSKVQGLNQWTSPFNILSGRVFKIWTVEIDIRVGRPCCWTRECHHRIPRCSPSPKLSSYPWGDHQSSGQRWPHGRGQDRSHQTPLLGCQHFSICWPWTPHSSFPTTPSPTNIHKPRSRGGGGLGKRQGDTITRCAKSLRPVIALAVSNATSRKWITHDFWIIWLQISLDLLQLL